MVLPVAQSGPVRMDTPTGSSQSTRSLYVPFGLDDAETVDVRVTLKPDEPYEGKRYAFNALSLMLHAHEHAIRQGVRLRVLGFGANRLFKNIGGREELEAALKRQGTQQQHDYLDRVQALELINSFAVDAIGEVLGLDQLAPMVMSSQELEHDSKVRDRILHQQAFLEDRMKGKDLIHFFGEDNEITVGSAFRKAQPRGILEGNGNGGGGNGGSNGKANGALDSGTVTPDDRYVLSEGAYASDVVLARGSMFESQVGGDKVNVGDGLEISLTQCLKQAVLRTLLKFDPDAKGMDEVLERDWTTSDELDGYAFDGSSGKAKAKRVSPYYLKPEFLRRWDEAERRKKRYGGHLIVPAVPWETGWVSNFMRDHGGGVANKGERAEVVSLGMNPVLARYVSFGVKNRSISHTYQQTFKPHQWDGLVEWANQDAATRPFIPETFTLTEFNDLVRIVGQDTGAEILRRIRMAAQAAQQQP